MPTPAVAEIPSKESLIRRFFPGTGRSYDRVVRLTTLGLDGYWKRRILDLVPPHARTVLDLACGTGILTFALLRAMPGLRVVGVDITEDYLRVARAKHERRGGDVAFHLGDAQRVPLAPLGPFDCVTSSYIPKYVDAERLVANVTPALRPGGRVILHDFTYPHGEIPKAVWHGYFRLLDPIARRLFPEWEKVFDRSLRDMIVRTRWPREFVQAFTRAGYEDVRRIPLSFSYAGIVTARRPGAVSSRP